jgi:hypothetical protein
LTIVIIEARACYAVPAFQASRHCRIGAPWPPWAKNGRAGDVPKWSVKGQASARALGYARLMVQRPSDPPRAIFPTGRAKWLWLALAGALGVWLIILLVTSGRDGAGKAAGSERAGSRLRERLEAAESSQKPFDGQAAEVFTQRQDTRARRSSTPPPLRLDQGQGE